MSQQVRKYSTVLAEKGVMPEGGCVSGLLTSAHPLGILFPES